MRLMEMVLAAALSCVLTTPAVACRTSVFSSSLRPNEVYLLAVPQGHTVRVPRVDPPQYMGPVRPSEGESAGDSLQGWIVHVEQRVGAGSQEISSAETGAILVPWGYGPDCRPRPWTKDEQWLKAGERGVFSAYLRPRSQWVGGRPVLDVFLAWHQPFPTGEFLKYEARNDPSTDAPWLTVDEYWSLVNALPTAEEARAAPERARGSLGRWAKAYPARANRFPASVILERAYLLAK